MAEKLDAFPGSENRGSPQKYSWSEWTDGDVWKITRGDDYTVPTENMRVNLHEKARSLSKKVRTTKTTGEDTEGLIFQFLESEEEELVRMEATKNPDATKIAMDHLYADAMEIYERARTEVTIERKDGRRQRYAPNRYRQQIEKGREDGILVPTVANIVKKPTLGFGHLENAERPDLMLETLVLDESKPYHRFFSPNTLEVARTRMEEYAERHP